MHRLAHTFKTLTLISVIFALNAHADNTGECPTCISVGAKVPDVISQVMEGTCSGSVYVDVDVPHGAKSWDKMTTESIQNATLKAMGFSQQDIYDYQYQAQIHHQDPTLIPYDAGALQVFIENARYVQTHSGPQTVLSTMDNNVCVKLKKFVEKNHQKKIAKEAVDFGPVAPKQHTQVVDFSISQAVQNQSPADRATSVTKAMGFDLKTIATLQDKPLDMGESAILKSFGLNPDKFPQILTTFLDNLGKSDNSVDIQPQNQAFVHVRIPVLTNSAGQHIRLDELMRQIADERKKPCDIKIDVSNFVCSDQPADIQRYVAMWGHKPNLRDAHILTQEELIGKVKNSIGFSSEAAKAYENAFAGKKYSDPFPAIYNSSEGQKPGTINSDYGKFYQACVQAQTHFQRLDTHDVRAWFQYEGPFMDEATCKRTKNFASAYKDMKDEGNALALGPNDGNTQLVRIQLDKGADFKTPDQLYQETMNNLHLDGKLLSTLDREPTPEEINELGAMGIDAKAIPAMIKKFRETFEAGLTKQPPPKNVSSADLQTSTSGAPKWMGYNYDKGDEVRLDIPLVATKDGPVPITDIFRQVALKREEKDADDKLNQQLAEFHDIVKDFLSFETNGVSDKVLAKSPESLKRFTKKSLDIIGLCFDGTVKGGEEAGLKFGQAFTALSSFGASADQQKALDAGAAAKLDDMLRDAEGKGQIRKNSSCFSAMHSISNFGVMMGGSALATAACAGMTGGNVLAGASCGAAVFAVSEMGDTYRSARAQGLSDSDANIKSLVSLFATGDVMVATSVVGEVIGALDPEEKVAAKSAYRELVGSKSGKALTEAQTAVLKKALQKKIIDVVAQCPQMSLFTVVGSTIANNPNENAMAVLDSTLQACKTGLITGALIAGATGAASTGKINFEVKAERDAVAARIAAGTVGPNDVLVTNGGDVKINKVRNGIVYATAADGTPMFYDLKAVEKALKNPTVAKENDTHIQRVEVEGVDGIAVTAKTPVAVDQVLNIDGKRYKVVHADVGTDTFLARALKGDTNVIDQSQPPLHATLQSVENARGRAEARANAQQREVASAPDEKTSADDVKEEKIAEANAPANRSTLKARFKDWIRNKIYKSDIKLQTESETAINSVLDGELQPLELAKLEKMTEEGGPMTPEEFKEMLKTCGGKNVGFADELFIPGILVGQSATRATACHI